MGLGAFGLGLARGEVHLKAHDPRWAKAFLELKSTLVEKLPSLTFHHVGSTSVPGIPAKPILDLLGTAPALEEIEACRPALEALGFEWKGEYGIPGRRYCPLYDDSKKTAFVHLHLFAAGHPEAAAHLLFRDFLRAHSGRANAYAALKESLAADLSLGREGYTEGKAKPIKELLAEAKAWAQGPA